VPINWLQEKKYIQKEKGSISRKIKANIMAMLNIYGEKKSFYNLGKIKVYKNNAWCTFRHSHFKRRRAWGEVIQHACY
jgi:hypothetical protein